MEADSQLKIDSPVQNEDQYEKTKTNIEQYKETGNVENRIGG